MSFVPFLRRGKGIFIIIIIKTKMFNTFFHADRCTHRRFFCYWNVLYISSSHNVSKSIPLVSGGVQKDLDSRLLFRHCIRWLPQDDTKVRRAVCDILLTC